MTRIILIFMFFGVTESVFAQAKPLKFASGVIYAGFRSGKPSLIRGNVYRWGGWGTLSQDIKLKKILLLEVGLSYQERMPFEAFSFGENFSFGVQSTVAIENYPTNPQNKYFRDGGFTRFPNFKYMNIELIPRIIIRKEYPVSFSLGVGLFGGLLLNRNVTTRTRYDFPGFEEWLVVQGVSIDAKILYNKYDFGWVPKLTMQFKINENMTTGIQFKSYFSLLRLNDSSIEVFPWEHFNMFWVAHAVGLSFQYRLNKKNR